MANETSTALFPSDPWDLVFSNCSLAGAWLSRWVQLSVQDEEFPALLTAQLIQDGWAGWAQNASSIGRAPTTREAVDWVYATEFEVLYHMTDYALWDCAHEFCAKMEWDGNPDLTGRGMVSTYVIQAVLTTLYVLALSILRIPRLRPDEERKPTLYRFLEVAKHSARPFLDTLMLFSIVMLAAAITTFGRGLSRKERSTTQYTSITTSLLSLYSVLPALLVQTCASPILRRPRWRRLGWATIALLGTAVIVLYAKTPLVPDFDSDTQARMNQELRNDFIWESACSNAEMSMTFKNIIWVLVGVLGAFSTAYIALECLLRRTKTRTMPKLKDHWWCVIVILGISAMWACLGLFLWFRTSFEYKYGQGDSKQGAEHEWTFGQILALGTWAPVVVEAGYVALQGPKRAMTGLMMKGFEAVPSEDVESAASQEAKEEPDESSSGLRGEYRVFSERNDDDCGEAGTGLMGAR